MFPLVGFLTDFLGIPDPGSTTANLFDNFLQTNIEQPTRAWREQPRSNMVVTGFVGAAASLVEFHSEMLRNFADTLRYGTGVNNAIRETSRLGQRTDIRWTNPSWDNLTWDNFVAVHRAAWNEIHPIASGLWDDFVRALNVIPVETLLSKGVARVGQLLGVRQRAGTNTCALVTFANKLRIAGYKLFVSEADVARLAGVSLADIEARGMRLAELRKLLDALRKLGIPYVEHPGADLDQLLQLVESKPNSVFSFSTINPRGGGHRLYARFSRLRGAVVFLDTNGAELSMSQFRQRYSFATGGMVRRNFPVVELPFALLLQGADFGGLFFPVSDWPGYAPQAAGQLAP